MNYKLLGILLVLGPVTWKVQEPFYAKQFHFCFPNAESFCVTFQTVKTSLLNETRQQ